MINPYNLLKKQFLKDFNKLLKKYNDDIDYEDLCTRGWDSDVKCIVTLNGIYDNNGNMVREFEQFNIMECYLI